MRPISMMFLCVSFLLASCALPAESHSSHTGVRNEVNPYICDVNDAVCDFTAGLVNDQGHLVLRVQSFTDTLSSYFCDNAGGFAPLSHAVSLDSISAWVKTTGDFNPSDVYVEIYVHGVPGVFYFNTTNARTGPTKHGYTLYTWKTKDLVGLKGFPEHPVISEFGFSINVYTIGAGSITGISVNSHPVPFACHTVCTCPFSDPINCVL